MERPGILRFEPLFRTVRWGGTRLGAFKGVGCLPSDTVGESWELSGLSGNETRVAEGPFAGRTVSELLEGYGRYILGERLHSVYGNFFPLLVKFLDAEDDLSVQVHPDDVTAPDGLGKTELWYVINAEPGSYIYSGFNRPMTRSRLIDVMAQNRLVDVLAKHFPMSGDVFFIPPGRIHSIGAGNLILEIQQTSGTTYRLHDHGRLDNDGKPRQLHVDNALDTIDYELTDFGLARPQLLIDCETRVKKTPYFTVTAAQVIHTLRLDIAETDSFRIIVALSGSGKIKGADGCEARIRQGQTLLVPAGMESVEIIAETAPLKLITAYC